jgi:hypothetical protein
VWTQVLAVNKSVNPGTRCRQRVPGFTLVLTASTWVHTFIDSEYLGSHFYWQRVPGFTLLLTSSTWVHTFIDSEYLGSHPLFCGIQVLLIVLVFPCCDVFFFPLVFIVFILCFVCPIFSESLDCRFLMDHSVFFNVYLIDWKQKMPLFWNGKIKPQYLISSTHSWIVR